HVRLARGDPHLAHKNVPHRDRVLPRRRHPHQPTCLELVEPHHPPALGIGFHRPSLAGKRHAHCLARIGKAPHRHARSLLEDHAVTEEGRKPDLGRSRGGHQHQGRNHDREDPTHHPPYLRASINERASSTTRVTLCSHVYRPSISFAAAWPSRCRRGGIGQQAVAGRHHYVHVPIHSIAPSCYAARSPRQRILY